MHAVHSKMLSDKTASLKTQFYPSFSIKEHVNNTVQHPNWPIPLHPINFQERQRETDRERQTERDRQRETEREKQTETETETDSETEKRVNKISRRDNC